jgi:ammonia channel protein AmtB
LGVIDFAGTGPVHVVGGAAALTAACFIGQRIGRYDKGAKSLPMVYEQYNERLHVTLHLVVRMDAL